MTYNLWSLKKNVRKKINNIVKSLLTYSVRCVQSTKKVTIIQNFID